MPYPEEKIKKVVEELLLEASSPRKVDVVVYRPDYMDYQVVMDGSHHSELREKLFDLIIKDQDPKGDARREIKYLLQNALAYEEWEKEDIIDQAGGAGDQGGPAKENKIGLDDKDLFK